MLDQLVQAILIEFTAFVEFLPRLFTGIIAFLLVYAFGRLSANATLRILKRSAMPEAYHFYFKKMISGIAVFIGIIVFLNLVGYSTFAASLVAGGGLTAVMLGFAFKDIGENFLAGFFLAFSRPFNTDDIIETGGITGKVKSIQLRHTHIRTSDGCDVFVPSAQLFTKPLHNYTLDGLRRGNFTIGIDYADDTKKAIETLLNILKNTKGVLKSPAPGASVKGFMSNYVELQVFFWINAKDQEYGLANVRTELMHSCRLTLIKQGFTFSSEVSTAVSLSPVDVSVTGKA